MLAAVIIIGFVLGAIGGGAGLLTLPVLVYLQGFSPTNAAPISITLVGASAAVTLLFQKSTIKEGLQKDLLAYTLGSLLMIYCTKWAMSSLKTGEWISVWWSQIIDHAIMLLFVPIILYSAWHAWPRQNIKVFINKWNNRVGFTWGMLTGFMAGLFGAGGGFIIVPVLHQGAKFPVQKAINASLLVIACNGIIGGMGALIWNQQMNSTVLVWMVLMSAGALMGRFWSKRQPPTVLKKSLAIFLTLVATAIFVKEINYLL